MKVKFWGVRGSIAAPGKDTVVFGGNTSCLEIRDDSGNTLVFDAGTGIRLLGNDLVKRGVKDIHLFISHTHWDHIQGFPFFTPVYIPGTKVKIYGPKHYEKTLKTVMDLQMDYAYFPISMQQLNAGISYADLQEATIELGGTKIITKYANHPVTGLCYKIVSGGKTVVYSGDMEPYYNVLDSGNPESDFLDAGGGADEDINEIVAERNENHRLFCQSDLLIHDAQYTEEEYSRVKGWGHSPMEAILRMARAGGIGQVVLSHHDPDRKDSTLLEIEKRLRKEFSDVNFIFSQEGMEIDL